MKNAYKTITRNEETSGVKHKDLFQIAQFYYGIKLSF